MVHAVFKVNEIDCDVCLSFLLKKLAKYHVDVEIFCGTCHTLTVKLQDESEISHISKIISDAGYDNSFEYLGTVDHQHLNE